MKEVGSVQATYFSASILDSFATSPSSPPDAANSRSAFFLCISSTKRVCADMTALPMPIASSAALGGAHTACTNANL